MNEMNIVVPRTWFKFLFMTQHLPSRHDLSLLELNGIDDVMTQANRGDSQSTLLKVLKSVRDRIQAELKTECVHKFGVDTMYSLCMSSHCRKKCTSQAAAHMRNFLTGSPHSSWQSVPQHRALPGCAVCEQCSDGRIGTETLARHSLRPLKVEYNIFPQTASSYS